MTKTAVGVKSNSSKENLSVMLAPLNSEVLRELFHRCADEICGRKGPSKDKLSSLCAWSHNQFEEAVALVKELIVDYVVHHLDRKKVEEILLLEEDQMNAVMNCLAVRGDELQKCLLDYYQSGSSQILSDHDWKLKWVMGSSSLSSLHETLLELDLMTVKHTNSKVPDDTGSQRGQIRVELTSDNVNTLISVLEKAHESLD